MPGKRNDGKGKAAAQAAGRGGAGARLRLLLLLLLAAAAMGLAWYLKQDESRKRYIKHLGKQIPYLPARYYA